MEISERYRDLIIDSFAWGPDLLRWRKEGTLFAPDPSAWFRHNIVRSQDPDPDIGTYGVLQEGIKATWWDIEYCMYHDICGSRFRLKSLG